jgi:hypothetical protein
MKREPGAWGYNWATLSLADINTETWSSWLGGWTQGRRPCFVNKFFVVKSKEVNTGYNLAESSEESYGSETAVLLLLLMMMVMMMMNLQHCQYVD